MVIEKMDINKIDRTLLKEIVKEIIAEDKSLLKEIVREVLVENEQKERQKMITKMINEDFDKYDEVFKALA